MDSYLRTLDQVSMAAKDVQAVRPEERRDSHQALKEGDIVAVLADDNPNYFWSVRLGRNFTCCQWHPRIPMTRLFSHYMQGLSHYIFSELPGFPWDEPGALESRKSHFRNGSETF